MSSELEIVNDLMMNDADRAAMADDIRESLSTWFVGKPMRYDPRSGAWSIVERDENNKKIAVSATATFTVDPLSHVFGFKKWVGHELLGQEVGRSIDGFKMPDRDDLGDS